jgi:putative ABC transport system substrate-binding protein
MLGTGEPVVTGIVSNLSHPGGNITGLSHMAPGLSGKRLELLKEVLPRVSSVMVLSYLTDPIAAPQLNEIKNAASALGITLQIHDIRSADDLPAAFNAALKEHTEAVLTTVESIFVVHRAKLIELTARYQLPAMYPSRTFVDAGGMMSYGVNFPTFWADAAEYVDKILKGADPGALPVEQPTEFELVINVKTAKALGITIPHSVLVRADTVIH